MTVEEHLAFALAVRRRDRRAIERRVGELAELLGLEKLLERKPAGLSGGESQRVALGRALSFHPQVLLLDEPLSALDEETREEMIVLLKSVRERTGVTTLHVTHNLTEAHRLADTVFLLRDGRIQQETLSGNEQFRRGPSSPPTPLPHQGARGASGSPLSPAGERGGGEGAGHEIRGVRP
jgi:ABC-type sugar transport system ATPase subunit